MTHTFRIVTRTDASDPASGIHEFTSDSAEFIVEIDGHPIVGLQNIEDGGGCLGIYPDGEHFKLLEVVTVDNSNQTMVTKSGRVLTDADVERFAAEDEDLKADLDSMKVWSPWTSAQAFQLNVFQARGNFHPFTCPNHETLGEVQLVATLDGWVCSKAPECTYTQDWAWEAMFDARNWRTTAEMGKPPEGCLCMATQWAGGWKIVAWNKRCEVHPQLKGTVLDPEVSGKQVVEASRPLHMGGGSVLREVGVPADDRMRAPHSDAVAEEEGVRRSHRGGEGE